MKKTSERLYEIMNEQNLKQSDIIERAKPFMKKYNAKLTRPDISQYCSGKVKPTQEKMFLLAAALNVSEAWLMGYDVPRIRTQETTEMAQTQPMRALLQTESEVTEKYIEETIRKAIHISNEEYTLLVAFRKADTVTQKNILKLLDIDDMEKNEEVI